ncbi:hypothetical protein [Streptomyces sp. HNM0574]|uniref:trypsin-like serine peptidase n=1 Tax=Streptomyces sp. HNM0574 TaxID=2714954 RepID=UPI00146D5C9E|nr:hypothetical protein [Streptomyces sp. HNM0574]NLU65708.1 hypothetical protein [Streptomyces sp. HNM0574]
MTSVSRGRRVTAAAAAVAALTLTATACQGTEDRASPGAADSRGPGGSPSADGPGLPDRLPEDLPTSLKDLEGWRNGEWKNWSRDDWLREAGDFVNPYLKDHWKPGRMKEAEDNRKKVPADVATAYGDGGTDPAPRAVRAEGVRTPYTRTAAPAGKIFMDTPDGPMVCSGTVVRDPRRPGRSNLVATAGHCVHSGASGGWLRNIMFVPAYNNTGLSPARIRDAAPQDVAPYGQWWSDWVQTTDHWIAKGAKSGGGGAQQDFAVLHVRPENGSGRSLEETVGNAVRVNFRAPRPDGLAGVTTYGYPQAAPYDGARMYSCTGRPGELTMDASQPGMYRVGCTMTGGSSGGGWLARGSDGRPELVSVNSIGPEPATWLAGPRLGPTAETVLDAVSRKFTSRR